MKDQITFTEFLEIEKKLEIKLGAVLDVVDVPKSTKLINLTVNFGPDDTRTVVTNIKPYLQDPTKLIGLSFLFITNLRPSKMMGIESQAMILPGEIELDKAITVNGEEGTKLL
jgi:methionyl-tRNA synthetase